MPDFTMCKTHNCPKAKDCLRARAIPDMEYQSYTYFDEKDDCFIKIGERDRVVGRLVKS